MLSARTVREAGLLSLLLQRADAHDARPPHDIDIIVKSSVKPAVCRQLLGARPSETRDTDRTHNNSRYYSRKPRPELVNRPSFLESIEGTPPDPAFQISRRLDNLSIEIPSAQISARRRLRRSERKGTVKMSDVKRAKYSLSVQGQPDWCHFCKCYVQSHSNSKRSHEQSNAHKKNVELKMREIRKQKQNEGKEEEAKQRMMANIESAAEKAYKADLAQAEAEKGAWKFDDRSNYYWHAKSSCYFDPKSGMFFNTKTNAWSKEAPANCPAPPAASGQTSTATERAAEGEQGPGGKTASTITAAACGSGALGVSAGPASGVAGLASAPKPNAAAGTTNAKSLTSIFNLGYGTNHPKYEAAKAKTQTSALRALDGAGGRKFEATDAKKLGVVTGTGDNSKRKRADGAAGGKKPKVSKEEAAALAKREAARARVEARTKKSFGLQ